MLIIEGKGILIDQCFTGLPDYMYIPTYLARESNNQNDGETTSLGPAGLQLAAATQTLAPA